MSKSVLALFFAGAAALLAGAQQLTAPPLPPPAVLSACLPDIGALTPLSRPDIGEISQWKGGWATVAATVEGSGSVTLKPISASDPSIAKVALDNLKTWKFAKHQPGRVVVTFVVKVARNPSYGVGNAKVEIDFPSRVTITVSPSTPILLRVAPSK